MQTSSRSVPEQKLEILQQLSRRSVDESFIVVHRDELHRLFHPLSLFHLLSPRGK